MSGFCGILNLDQQPVAAGSLKKMAGRLIRIGPDRQGSMVNGPVGFAHALFQTTVESTWETQPLALNNWYITGEVRIDDRQDLVKGLRSLGYRVDQSMPDIKLVLFAWQAYREDVPCRLFGDFAFAVWDCENRSLFCVRDHMGTIPFFYAKVGRSFIFSNALNCLRCHPELKTGLNDQAIVDYLVFGINMDNAKTFFANIFQLPPGHLLEITNGTTRIRRYWQVPVEDMIRYRNPTDYIEHFNEIFSAAVNDRLRTDRIGVSMSGGMDSTSVAAVAAEQLERRFQNPQLFLVTQKTDALWPGDQEGYYASQVAERLGIPIDFVSIDKDGIGRFPFTGDWPMPEPNYCPVPSWAMALLRCLASYAPVSLTGHGGDAFMSMHNTYLADLMKKGRWLQALRDFIDFIASFYRLPSLNLRSGLKKRFGGVPPVEPPPPWLKKSVADRFSIHERWYRHQTIVNKGGSDIHPTHPRTYNDLTSPLWQHVFLEHHPHNTGLTMAVRHPFMDIRMIRYVLRIPPMPWCYNKELTRKAMRNRLPDPVLKRQKSPVGVDLFYEAFTKLPGDSILEEDESLDTLKKYLRTDIIKLIVENPNRLKAEESWLIWRPLNLADWLRHLQ